MAGKKPDFSVQGLDVLGLSKKEQPTKPPIPAAAASSSKQTKPTPKDDPSPPAQSFVVAPLQKKEPMSHARLTRLTKSLNDQVTRKLEAEGLTYNYVVNKLLERWLASSQ